MTLAELRKLVRTRTEGEWVFNTYSPVPGRSYEDQFYDWYVETALPGHPHLRICSHEATNHDNGIFIAAMANHIDALLDVVEAAKEWNDFQKSIYCRCDGDCCYGCNEPEVRLSIALDKLEALR